MKDKNKREIDKIKAGMHCPAGFVCVNNNFEQLCKIKETGVHDFIECSEENPVTCPFGVMCEDKRFCECPLRIYLFRDLGK